MQEMKVKIFNNTNLIRLEEVVNQFLIDEKIYKVEDIKFQDTGSSFSVMIMYRNYI